MHLSSKRSILISVLKPQSFFSFKIFKCLSSRSRAAPWGRTSSSNPSNPSRAGSEQRGQITGNQLHQQPQTRQGDELGPGATHEQQESGLKNGYTYRVAQRRAEGTGPRLKGAIGPVDECRSQVRLVRAILTHHCTQDWNGVLWI